MGAYLDTSWADLRALTRARRAEAHAARLAALPASVRFSVIAGGLQALEARMPDGFYPRVRRNKRAAAKWLALQQEAGVDACGYCGTGLTWVKDRLNSATVDHREPWLGGSGGADDPSNWLVACLACNRAKGCMPEAVFRRLLCEAAE